MNEKLNIQDLIDTLAERHGMSKKNADSFVKEFFQLIEESLEKDKYVKIRGLGTFKLIDVGSRESVNVNTGERFEIQGHTKVSFTPEPALKDIINRPFSHFETVVLNDATVLEDTLQENDSEDDEDTEIKTPEQEVEEKVALVEEATIEEPLVETVVEEPLVEPEPEVEEEKPEKTEPEAMPENIVAVEPEPSEPVIKDTADSSTMKYFIGIVVFVVLLCGGAVAFMYYPDLLDKLTAKPLVEEVADSDVKESVTEKVDVPAGQDNIALTDSIVSKDVVVPARTDTVAETVATTTPALTTTPKENVQVQSPAPKKRAEKVPNRGVYFDLLSMYEYIQKENYQYPSTPSLSHMFALNYQLEKILKEGLENRFKRHEDMAKIVRNWAEEHFEIFTDKNHLSNTLTVVKNTQNIDVSKLNEELQKRGYLIANGYGDLKDKTFRISHMEIILKKI